MCKRAKGCTQTFRTEFEGDNFICVGMSNCCDLKCDHLRLCVKSQVDDRIIEMTEKEGLVIANGLIHALYEFAFPSKE